MKMVPKKRAFKTEFRLFCLEKPRENALKLRFSDGKYVKGYFVNLPSEGTKISLAEIQFHNLKVEGIKIDPVTQLKANGGDIKYNTRYVLLYNFAEPGGFHKSMERDTVYNQLLAQQYGTEGEKVFINPHSK